MINEKKGFSINGYLAFFAVLPVLQLGFGFMVLNQILLPLSVFCTVVVLVCWGGFFMVQPNQAKVMTLFGSYVGTEKRNGLRWTIPFFMRKTVSLRVRN
ncbi:MAG: SPFH domain-containing protein, partial [Paraglaciecola sp.]